ncbi:MAG: alpha/beta fold hydrolase [Actinobacteria bacterium]|nr:MAG: alpha/beta fold hydrolase [Actinomycetota bacterium]
MTRPTVLFLHAFPLDSRMWKSQRRAVEEAGWAVAAPDLPGDEPEVSFAAWAERVLGFVEGDLVPVGNSMGGYLAFELWRQAPDRIRALVLVDTRAGPEPEDAKQTRNDLIQVVGEDGAGALWQEDRPAVFAHDAGRGVIDAARHLVHEQPVTGLVAALEAIRDRVDSRPTLSTIDVPVLVVVGEEDDVTPPSEAEALAAVLPDARLLRIPGAGHLPSLEQPDEFNRELLAFLGETAA